MLSFFELWLLYEEVFNYRTLSLASVLLTVASGEMSTRKMKRLNIVSELFLLTPTFVSLNLAQTHPPGHQRVLHRKIHPRRQKFIRVIKSINHINYFSISNLKRRKIQKRMNPETPRQKAQWKFVQVQSTLCLRLPPEQKTIEDWGCKLKEPMRGQDSETMTRPTSIPSTAVKSVPKYLMEH